MPDIGLQDAAAMMEELRTTIGARRVFADMEIGETLVEIMQSDKGLTIWCDGAEVPMQEIRP